MATYNSYSNLRADLAAGKTSCVEQLDTYLARIQSESDLNAILEIFESSAREKAVEVDQKLKDGTAGKLAGMVIALKDNICYRGHKVSAASKILENFESLYSATVVERLLAEDAIIIARTNCDEFAMGASNENSAFGNVKNYKDKSRVPGGSSGGSVVAVQAELCHAALGSDTGGSIRQPASFTGTVGFKPTYGRVSRWGLLAYASSFDQIGPITRSVEDAALITEVMAGPDDQDATALTEPVKPYDLTTDAQPKKLAVIRDTLEAEGVQPEVKTAFESVLKDLEKAGHQIEYVDFPFLDVMVPTYYVLTTAEASSNLSRYSGLMYGYRSPNAKDLENTFTKSRSEGFGEEVKRRIMTGTFVLSSDHYDAYYTKGQKVRRVIKNKTEELLKQYDFLLCPTTPTTAFKMGEKSEDPIAMYLADIYTVQANLAGIPAISIPKGQDADGMDIGLQIMGAAFEEEKLLSFAQYVEKL